MTPLLWISLYLGVGFLVLGVFDMIDDWIEDMRKEPRFSHGCTAILALALWPIVVMCMVST